VLEHCDDPAQAVRELRRVTAPGGRVLASTHGVQVYHPSPVDYWRWTHEGLRRLFEQSGDWSSLTVDAAAGTASALAMLLGTYVESGLRRTPLARPPVWMLNRLGAALDARSATLRDPVPGSLIPNLHVVASV
jgi:SAM-dependent methyltransferase